MLRTTQASTSAMSATLSRRYELKCILVGFVVLLVGSWLWAGGFLSTVKLACLLIYDLFSQPHLLMMESKRALSRIILFDVGLYSRGAGV